MPGGITRWIRAWCTDRPLLVGLALLLLAAPFATRADEATQAFQIKAQPLSQALMAFGVQTGAIVVASSKLTTSKVSRPVTGQFTRQEALTRMLQGTGLQFETTANGSFLIVRAPRPGR